MKFTCTFAKTIKDYGSNENKKQTETSFGKS